MKNNNDITKTLRGKNILKIISFFAFFFIFFSLINLNFSHAITQAKGSQSIELTAIDISDHTIKIKATGHLTYSIYRASDPFTVMLDIEGASLGKFTQKIFSKSSGITEIRPFQVTNPIPMARLEILLSEPSDLIPQIKDGSLILTVKAEEKPLKEDIFSSLSNSAKTITAVKFEKSTDSIEIVVKGDGNMPDPQVSETENSITLFIPNVTMKASLPQKILSPVKEIKHNTEKDGLKLHVDFERNVDALAFAFADEIIIDIPNITESPKKIELIRKEDIVEKSSPIIAKPEITPPPPQTDNSKLISLDFQDADVTAILRLLADVSGKNIIIHPEVKGKISMKLVNVPWEQALDIVSKTYNLSKVEEGNVIMVQPYSTFISSNKSFAEAKDTQKLLEPLQVKTFTINYADIYAVEQAIKDAKILTPRGNVSVIPSPAKDLKAEDPVDKFTSGEKIGREAAGKEKIFYRKRGGILIVNDIPSILPSVDKLVAELDKPSVQFQIQARIVELNTQYERDLGIQWGLSYKSPNTLWSIGGPNPMTNSNFIVDMPVNPDGRIPLNVGSGFTFGLMNPAGTMSLDLKLSAIEQANKGKIISTPRLLTVEKQKARVFQGFSIPYIAEISKEGTASVDFKDVAIIIEVTPHLTQDNKIILDVITIKEDLVSFVKLAGADAPFTRKAEGNTRVIMSDGETFVIGGIYQKNEKNVSEGVPGLMNVPVLGWLFKNKQIIEDTREMIIFITPRILDKSTARR